jgi:hypothetical protein
LWNRWIDLWNGDLELAQQIIHADGAIHRFPPPRIPERETTMSSPAAPRVATSAELGGWRRRAATIDPEVDNQTAITIAVIGLAGVSLAGLAGLGGTLLGAWISARATRAAAESARVEAAADREERDGRGCLRRSVGWPSISSNRVIG